MSFDPADHANNLRNFLFGCLMLLKKRNDCLYWSLWKGLRIIFVKRILPFCSRVFSSSNKEKKEKKSFSYVSAQMKFSKKFSVLWNFAFCCWVLLFWGSVALVVCECVCMCAIAFALLSGIFLFIMLHFFFVEIIPLGALQCAQSVCRWCLLAFFFGIIQENHFQVYKENFTHHKHIFLVKLRSLWNRLEMRIVVDGHHLH